MPPMIATPIAIPQSKEQELEQEFELDIRVSSVSTLPTLTKDPEFAHTHTGCTLHTACTRNNKCCTG